MPSELNALNLLYGLGFDQILNLHTGENKIYLLKSNVDLFVLKAFRSNRSQRINILDEFELSKTLCTYGMEKLDFIPSIRGNYVEDLDGTKITLFRFSSGMMLFAPEGNDYFRLGQELRRLHNIPWERPVLPKLDFFTTIEQNWEHILNASFLSDSIKVQFNYYKNRVRDSFNFNGQSCVHFDLHWGNMLVNQEKMLFLDWEECGVGNPLLDIGTINAHLMRKENRKELLQALLDGYGGVYSNEEINVATTIKFLNLSGHIPTKLDIPQLKDTASIFKRYLSYFELLNQF